MKGKFLAVLFGVSCLAGCSGVSATVSLSREMLQSHVGAFFPLTSDQLDMKDLPAKVTVTDPVILLENGQDRIGIKVNVLVERTADSPALPGAPAMEKHRPRLGEPSPPGPRFPGASPPSGPPGASPAESSPAEQSPPQKHEGSITVRSGIFYNPDEGAFYVLDPTYEGLTFPSPLPKPLEQPVQRAIEALLSKYLKTHPIYRLEGDDLKFKTAKALLKSVTVKDGKLEVQIGL